MPAENDGEDVSFKFLLRHLDARFEGSDRYNSAVISELDKRFVALMAEKSLRDEQRFQAQEASTKIAFRRADEALSEAKNASALGFTKSNEWQATFRDLSTQYLSRAEFAGEIKAIETLLSSISARLGKIEGARIGMGQVWGVVAAVLVIVIAAAAVLVDVMHK